MSNQEKFDRVFCDTFSVEVSALNADFTHDNVDGWDSVRQLSLTTALEDEFDIMFDAEDILEMTSYEKGREIMSKYEIEL